MVSSRIQMDPRIPTARRLIASRDASSVHGACVDAVSSLAVAPAEAVGATRSRWRLRRRAVDLPDIRARWARPLFVAAQRRPSVAPAHASHRAALPYSG